MGLHHAGYQSKQKPCASLLFVIVLLIDAWLFLAGDPYGDMSGYMGYSNDKIGVPQMCYNAGNHWELGWFPSAKLELQPPSVPQYVTVIAFTDYPQRLPNDKVLVHVGNLYMQYNRRKSYNIGTPAQPDKLVIVMGGTYNSQGRTYLQGGLDLSNPAFVSDQYGSTYDVQVRVCRQYTRSNGVDVMEISIGRLGTNCNVRPTLTTPIPPTPVIRPAPSPPRPQQAPTTWWVSTSGGNQSPVATTPNKWSLSWAARSFNNENPDPDQPRPTTTTTKPHDWWTTPIVNDSTDKDVVVDDVVGDDGDDDDDDDDDDDNYDDDDYVNDDHIEWVADGEDDIENDFESIWVAGADPTPKNSSGLGA